MNGMPALPPTASIDPHSLYVAFEQITDGRHKRGLRYPLAVLLSLIVLAKLSGETTLAWGGGVGETPPGMACCHLPSRPAALSVFLDLHLCVGETVGGRGHSCPGPGVLPRRSPAPLWERTRPAPFSRRACLQSPLGIGWKNAAWHLGPCRTPSATHPSVGRLLRWRPGSCWQPVRSSAKRTRSALWTTCSLQPW